MTFKPLLAATVPEGEMSKVTYPVMWSPKLDGIRTLMVPELGACSRKIKRIPNDKVWEFLQEHLALIEGFDGEVIFGNLTDPDVFNRTQSAVMKIAGPAFDEADGRYLVFDDFSTPDLPFKDRYEGLCRRVEDLPEVLRRVIKVVPHKMVANAIDLENVERIVVEKGFEGVMIRSTGGRYKFGRSTLKEGILAKIKRFEDDEATIVGFEEMMHNDNEKERDALGHAKRATLQENLRAADTLGALWVHSPKYNHVILPGRGPGEFKIGSGFTAQLKQDLWDAQDTLLGKVVTFKFQPSGMKDLPRFPVFKSFRED